VLPDPSTVAEADVLLLESTYGDRTHQPDDDGAALARIVNNTVQRGGKVIIPAFALGRVEELLYWIKLLEERRAIPSLPVYVDSPMAAAVLTLYRKRAGELDADLAARPGDGRIARAAQGLCAFCTSRLRVVSGINESRQVQDAREAAIVISASGMATGGRVLHHLRRALPDPRNTVLFVGYQAAGTRGRALKDGVKTTRIHGEDVPVRAEIEGVDSMSAHADANEIMRWLGGFTRPPAATYLVHGEPGPMDALKARIERERQWTVRTPAHQETTEL
jgi:metallo-beta-lactamase family protein